VGTWNAKIWNVPGINQKCARNVPEMWKTGKAHLWNKPGMHISGIEPLQIHKK
jgi:hypothetical protein